MYVNVLGLCDQSRTLNLWKMRWVSPDLSDLCVSPDGKKSPAAPLSRPQSPRPGSSEGRRRPDSCEKRGRCGWSWDVETFPLFVFVFVGGEYVFETLQGQPTMLTKWIIFPAGKWGGCDWQQTTSGLIGFTNTNKLSITYQRDGARGNLQEAETGTVLGEDYR